MLAGATDRNPGNEQAHATFLKINESYQVLSNERTRREYDRMLADRRPINATQFDRSGPKRTVRIHREDLRPDDWIQFRRKNSKGRPSRPFDYETHEREHYGPTPAETIEKFRAKQRGQQMYAEEMARINRDSPRIVAVIAIVGIGVFAMLQLGLFRMIFMDDENPSWADDETVDIETFTLDDGKDIYLVTSTNTNDSGSTVWNSGRCLGIYLKNGRFGGKGSLPLLGKRVLDLGSGTGIVGICAARLGADVMLTDTRDVVKGGLLALNVAKNPLAVGEGSLTIRELDWLDALCPSKLASLPAPASFDLVVGADITYKSELMDGLVATIKFIAAKRVMIALERRDNYVIEKFLDGMKASGYSAKRALGKEYESESIEDAELVEIWTLITRIMSADSLEDDFVLEETQPKKRKRDEKETSVAGPKEEDSNDQLEEVVDEKQPKKKKVGKKASPEEKIATLLSGIREWKPPADFPKDRSLKKLISYVTAEKPKDGKSQVIVVSPSAERAITVIPELKKLGKIGKLFARHIKIAEHIKLCKTTYFPVSVGTPNRVLKLLEADAIDINTISNLIVDSSYVDKKERGILDIPELQADLKALLQRLPTSSKLTFF
ncbi:hypothetical protein HDU76_011204 [Blyttiomyces sp. JEL0837]|nr:hypothetical protein HDU76_011204 [Blyttiomyces sp. JEL0837]